MAWVISIDPHSRWREWNFGLPSASWQPFWIKWCWRSHRLWNCSGNLAWHKILTKTLDLEPSLLDFGGESLPFSTSFSPFEYLTEEDFTHSLQMSSCGRLLIIKNNFAVPLFLSCRLFGIFNGSITVFGDFAILCNLWDKLYQWDPLLRVIVSTSILIILPTMLGIVVVVVMIPPSPKSSSSPPFSPPTIILSSAAIRIIVIVIYSVVVFKIYENKLLLIRVICTKILNY